MKGRVLSVLLPLVLVLLAAVGYAAEIRAFCGAALRLPLEELATAFEEERGIRVVFTFGGSGTVLSQMKLSGTGDLFIPGSSDYLEAAKKEGLVLPGTERRIAFLIPAILVRKGNPMGIRGLGDLGRPGVRVAMGNPETVAVGVLAREILQEKGLWERVRGNIVTYTETGPKLVTLLALGAVDAVIGFRVWGVQNGKRVEVIPLPPEELPRVSRVSGAVSAFCRDPGAAEAFLRFLAGPRGQEVFRRWGYVVTEEEARALAPGAFGR